MAGSYFDPIFQNWLWFVLFIVQIPEIRLKAIEERLWQDDFWTKYYPTHLIFNLNRSNIQKFFLDIATFANMCLDPDLPFQLQSTNGRGIGVFPNGECVDAHGAVNGRNFVESLFGFSFTMACTYAVQLQACDMISDIVSMTEVQNGKGFATYYWI